MVIFEDLRKLLLYQKLNLGFECQLCKKKFYNRIEHLEHTSTCSSDLKCPKCGKIFGHARILQLHLQLHSLSESTAPQSPDEAKGGRNESIGVIPSENEGGNGGVDTKRISEESRRPITLSSAEASVAEPSIISNCDVDRNNTAYNMPVPFNILETCVPKRKSSQKAKAKPKQAKKHVGLTKIKMEDCLRCDACSCIYIDEKDYYKHMRNFHHLDMNNTPIKQQKAKRKCQSCCKQCRGSHCTSVRRPRVTQRSSNLIFRINMRDNIKNRWTKMISQQLIDSQMPDSTATEAELGPINIKPDPDADIAIKQEPEPDLSYLLSQVEVKIKTEPPDDY